MKGAETFSPPKDPEARAPGCPFPVVGIGASAGGLSAFTLLLRHLSPDCAMAFVLVQHLDPGHESQLAEILGRISPLPVLEIEDGMAIRPGQVHVIPPNTLLTLARGVLHLSPRDSARPNLPIDHFLRSLALEQQDQSIGVVLSGTGSDGTLGLREIRAAGGITFAQDEGSAQSSGMRDARDSERVIIETLREPLLILDGDLRIVTANRAFRETFQVAAEDTAGRLVFELGDGQWDIPRLRLLLDLLLSTGEPIDDFEVEHDFLGVGRRVMRLNVCPLPPGAGARKLLLAIEDISLRRQAEQAARAAQEQLRDDDRRKDEFLVVLAHELRSPLAAIGYSLQAAMEERIPAARAHEIIGRQTRQLSRLVEDLVDVGRIRRDKLELRKEPVALSEVLDRAVEISASLVEAGRHRLTVTSAAVLLQADPVRLAQALGNLLLNAAKYTPPGGDIWLSAERDPPRAGARSAVTVRVRDNGPGISPKLLPHVFELFRRGEEEQKRSPGGLGVGLSLARRLVEAHGGTLSAHSAGAGHGSEFILHLPLAEEEQPAPAPVKKKPRRLGAGPPRRILVVDDNVDVAEGLAAILEGLGHEVRVAENGMEALGTATAFHPEVVLLDIGLPDLDGHEVARRLRALPGLSGMLIVAVTGWDQARDRHLSKEAGIDHHMVKPVLLDALLALLHAPRAPTGTAPTA